MELKYGGYCGCSRRRTEKGEAVTQKVVIRAYFPKGLEMLKSQHCNSDLAIYGVLLWPENRNIT